MPKLPNQRITAEAGDGTRFDQEVSVYVDSTGYFYFAVPDDLADVVGTVPPPLRGPYVERCRDRGKDRIKCKQLDAGRAYLNDCAKAFVTVETKTSRVILYALSLQVSFWLDESGKFCPNGYDGGSLKGNWWEPKSTRLGGLAGFNDATDFYSVGIAAAVFDKVTHKRASGDSIEWRRYREDNRADRSPAAALNAFCRLSFDPEEHVEFREMPYSDKAARFFVEVMLGLCRIAKGIDDFFSDEKRLLSAINSGLALEFGNPPVKNRNQKPK